MNRFSLLTITLLVFALLQTGCGKENYSAAPATPTAGTNVAVNQQFINQGCYTNSLGQSVTSTGAACAAPVNNPPQGSTITTYTTNVGAISCDPWNQLYGYQGAYYVPMQTDSGYYCFDIAQYVPDYQQYYTSGDILYGSSCPYGAGNCDNWSQSGSTCVGIGAGSGGAYGVSGYFGICF